MRHGLAVLLAIGLNAGWAAALGAEAPTAGPAAPDAAPPPKKDAPDRPPGSPDAKPPSIEKEYAQALAAGPAPPAKPLPIWSGLLLEKPFKLEAGAVLNFVAQYTRTREGHSSHDVGIPSEAELDLLADFGPYVRGFVVLAVGRGDPEDVEQLRRHQPSGFLRHEWVLTDRYTLGIEEAYLTFIGLPWNLTARVGKFKAAFGWANSLHSHALPWVDLPLPLRNFLGDDQLAGEGVELAWLAPWDRPYTELIYQVFRSDTDTVFATDRWNDPVHLLHLRNLFDLAETSTFEAGLSGATGPANGPRENDRATLEGIDLTYKWVSAERGLYESFQWHTEFFASQKENDAGHRQNAFGAYTSPEYQFARQWSAGTRLDYSQMPDDHRQHEAGATAFVTYRPVEKAYWRLQVTRTNRNFDPEAETILMLQFNVTLGAHPAHRY